LPPYAAAAHYNDDTIPSIYSAEKQRLLLQAYYYPGRDDPVSGLPVPVPVPVSGSSARHLPGAPLLPAAGTTGAPFYYPAGTCTPHSSGFGGLPVPGFDPDSRRVAPVANMGEGMGMGMGTGMTMLHPGPGPLPFVPAVPPPPPYQPLQPLHPQHAQHPGHSQSGPAGERRVHFADYNTVIHLPPSPWGNGGGVLEFVPQQRPDGAADDEAGGLDFGLDAGCDAVGDAADDGAGSVWQGLDDWVTAGGGPGPGVGSFAAGASGLEKAPSRQFSGTPFPRGDAGGAGSFGVGFGAGFGSASGSGFESLAASSGFDSHGTGTPAFHHDAAGPSFFLPPRSAASPVLELPLPLPAPYNYFSGFSLQFVSAAPAVPAAPAAHAAQ
ncbi:hypothetical protein N0V85_009805, partial [Neurospora sp. IMI 360204]